MSTFYQEYADNCNLLDDFYFYFIHLHADFHPYHNFKCMEIWNIKANIMPTRIYFRIFCNCPHEFVHLSGVRNMEHTFLNY